MDVARLSVLHWNDVYRVTPQKLSSYPNETIDVAHFAGLITDLREKWHKLPDGTGDGLSLFSGDVFSPSIESSVTRGSHMVPVMNMLAPDVSLTGNHDFDFGYPHLAELIRDTTFPWVLSNIIDTTTSRVPEELHEFRVIQRSGLRIGIIGLVEREWIETVATWPPSFVYKDMVDTGLDLSRRLRDPKGEHRCDLIIALTHSRIPNDILLARGLLALSPLAQDATQIASAHGVDMLLGGHDHVYYVSKGVTAWEGYDLNGKVLGAEADYGDVLIVKSGTDFRDLSELTLEVESTPPDSVRRKVIKRIIGKRHTIKPECKPSLPMQKLLRDLLSSVSKTLDAPVCRATTTIDCRSQYIRTDESAVGNWFADILRYSYDEALCMKGCGGSDGVFICAGTIRGDSIYGPGIITLGNILEILPFEDPIVVIELDGAAIWEALETSLSTWPAQEGRFPIVSGFRVFWDSRRESGHRVLGVWLLKHKKEGNGDNQTLPASDILDIEEVTRESNGRKYRIITREYMAEGHDGYNAFQGKPLLIDGENGHLFSTIVRKYLLGSLFVNKMANLVQASRPKNLQPRTNIAISRAATMELSGAHESRAHQHWTQAINLIFQRSRSHYQDQLMVCATEDMSGVDQYDGRNIRTGQPTSKTDQLTMYSIDLLLVNPEVDGRLKDKARNS